MASGWNDVADLFPGMDAGDLVDAHNYENLPHQSYRMGGQPCDALTPRRGRTSISCI